METLFHKSLAVHNNDSVIVNDGSEFMSWHNNNLGRILISY